MIELALILIAAILIAVSVLAMSEWGCGCLTVLIAIAGVLAVLVLGSIVLSA